MNVIVGAGIAGLTLAHRLSSESNLILEKSKAIGGRMATRRVDEYTFDHGAQFYHTTDLAELDKLWTDCGLSLPWIIRNGGKLSASPNGMTALAKAIAASPRLQGRVLKEKQVERIERNENQWRAWTDKNEVFQGERLFLTCPLPQTLKILNHSGISYPECLNSVQYDKTLVGLFGLGHNYQFPTGFKLVEFVSESIRMVSNQTSKGVSSYPAIAVVMKSEWSERNFDFEDEKILEGIRIEVENYFRSLDLELSIKSSSLKKWRYGFVREQKNSTNSEVFLNLSQGLYILGDSLGGADLGGAFRSAVALSNHILARN